MSTLIKTELHSSIAESVFKEITSKTGRYYYYLGSVLDWEDIDNPPVPINSPSYEKDVRKHIIMVKEIQPGDVSFVIDKIQWQSGTVYDMYDDSYSDSVIGVNLQEGGQNYTSNANITIEGGGGTGASANLIIDNGSIIGVTLYSGGSGYTTTPNVIIQDSFGSGAIANAVLNFAYSGTNVLEDSNFYVINDEFNIYKCLDNNYDSPSTDMPLEINPEPFVTSDGYKWKYIATVPISLRNRFATNVTVPITNALTDQFYSSGQIKSVNVLDTGNNYTYASLVVTGDGYLDNEPYVVVNPTIINGGSGYATANIIIQPPYVNTNDWIGNTNYFVGVILQHENNIYEVVQTGVSANYPPVHTTGIVQNGTVGLKFLGTKITANANISGGEIVGLLDLTGSVRDVIIVNGGSGYISAPVVSFVNGDGINVSAYTNIVDGTVTRVIFLDHGRDFTIAPNVVFGVEWTANSNVTINDQIFYDNRLYTVTGSGSLNVTAPVHTVGEQQYGTANLTYAGIPATGYSTLKYGSGYRFEPTVTIEGDGSGAEIEMQAEKTEAILYPYIEDGKITRVLIYDGGIGYTAATISVNGDGDGGQFELNLSNGDLISIQSTSELLAVDGAIHAIKIISGGYGYISANVTIDGDGTGATAEAEIVNGKIGKINVINEGSGYTVANVTIDGIGGHGATARAILPPFGGHGSDPISELYARTIVFYTSISRELNHGLVVDNEYRQFGIIKDIKNYLNNKFYNGVIGSGCWLLSGTIDINNFTKDMIITRTTDNARFLIVTSTSESILVIPLDGKNPSNGDAMKNSLNNQFQVTGVSEPDIDKYSGKLLYIDNRAAFSASNEQAISIKTNFRF